MQLTHDRAQGYFFIRAVRADAVVVIDRELRSSFLIAPDRVIENWPVSDISTMDSAAMSTVLQLCPEVFLLGTGVHQIFPSQQVLLPLLRTGIGVEVMDNAAAGRTYNLLVSEGRQVVAAFILGDGII